MISYLAIGFLSGALLGLRYKVLALVPAILATASIILVCNAFIGGGIRSIVVAALITAIFLQLGYVAGLGLRLVLLLTRAARSGPISTAVAT
jgi:hypothetical protein